MNRLPPLNPLRAFEAAARLGSFQKAAEELNVTPPAISHQVRVLEEYLDVTLFHREARRVRLTEQGEMYLAAVSEGLHRIAAATRLLLKATEKRPLTVSSAPSFACGWLVPRLVDFHTRHPDVEVRLDTSVQLVDLLRSDIDVAIRYTA
ncbi:MAG: LysR family transcriptional regulator, partial [Cyclobacteriaceae bacterium]|nr:LysR family transcriptional regulator [Cyclobacteriaceae bacterium]